MKLFKRTPAPVRYFQRKSEVTALAHSYLDKGCEYYRTHLTCGCHMNNYRQGVLVVKSDRIVCRIVRCAACAGARKEAADGNV